MVDTFKIYKGQTEVVSGQSPLTITGMEPNTSVSAGEYQVTRVVNGKESERVDIPAFKTLSIAVTGLEFSPKTSTADAGTAGSRQITATVLPENATNKKVTYKRLRLKQKVLLSLKQEILLGQKRYRLVFILQQEQQRMVKKQLNTP